MSTTCNDRNRSHPRTPWDECEQHDAALAHIERVVATTPALIDAWSAATVRENPAYAQVLTARAGAPLLANRPAEGESRLHELSDRAPFNLDIRTSFASSLRVTASRPR